MTEITISAAKPDDVQAMSGLLAEMDRFYGSVSIDPDEIREQQIYQALFSETPAGHALLARHDERLVGLAAYTFLWPAVGLTRSLYLKELRDRGLPAPGSRQAAHGRPVRDRSRAECSRVEWTTDNDNSGATAFSAGLGVPVEASKVFYRAESNGDSLHIPG